MIRIVYSWEVSEPNQEAFISIWKKTTNSIHENVKGARGSLMIQEYSNPLIIKTLARWDSFEDWEVFWKDSNPHQMSEMHTLGKRISVEIFKEIEDFTR